MKGNIHKYRTRSAQNNTVGLLDLPITTLSVYDDHLTKTFQLITRC